MPIHCPAPCYRNRSRVASTTHRGGKRGFLVEHKLVFTRRATAKDRQSHTASIQSIEHFRTYSCVRAAVSRAELPTHVSQAVSLRCHTRCRADQCARHHHRGITVVELWNSTVAGQRWQGGATEGRREKPPQQQRGLSVAHGQAAPSRVPLFAPLWCGALQEHSGGRAAQLNSDDDVADVAQPADGETVLLPPPPLLIIM